jgi:hypothetical protein
MMGYFRLGSVTFGYNSLRLCWFGWFWLGLVMLLGLARFCYFSLASFTFG